MIYIAAIIFILFLVRVRSGKKEKINGEVKQEIPKEYIAPPPDGLVAEKYESRRRKQIRAKNILYAKQEKQKNYESSRSRDDLWLFQQQLMNSSYDTTSNCSSSTDSISSSDCSSGSFDSGICNMGSD